MVTSRIDALFSGSCVSNQRATCVKELAFPMEVAAADAVVLFALGV